VVTLADGRSARAGSAELDALMAEIAPPRWSLQREDRTPHLDAGPVHLVTTATLATLRGVAGERFPVERLRPNLMLM
jgi:MOSC domain-containing protein